MQTQIPDEIRTYEEKVLAGLTTRQLVCSAITIAVAVALRFALVGVVGGDISGIICMLGAAPFAAAGFFRYNSMSFERFVWAAFKSELLFAGNRVWRARNYCLEFIQKEVEGSNEPVQDKAEN